MELLRKLYSVSSKSGREDENIGAEDILIQVDELGVMVRPSSPI